MLAALPRLSEGGARQLSFKKRMKLNELFSDVQFLYGFGTLAEEIIVYHMLCHRLNLVFFSLLHCKIMLKRKIKCSVMNLFFIMVSW